MKLKAFTMPSTGIVVVVPPVSIAALTMQLRREMPEPKPPLIKVNVAGHESHERNAADPDYLKSYAIWEQTLQIEATDRFLKRVALKQRLTDDQRQEIAEIREALDGESLPKSDKLLWFFEVAIGADSDIQALVQFSQKLADPQEERIIAESNGFQGKVQRAEHMGAGS